MAWNQPNGGQNNPWGRRPGGANDLDARLRNWQRRLESWFRPGVSGGEGSWLFFIVVVAVLLVWLASGTYQVGQAERGVIQRFGRFVEVKPPGMGWHAPWPIETVTKVNVTGVNSSDFKSRVLTADVNLVELHFAVQYQFADPVKALFGVKDPEETLSQVSESAIREIVGRSTLDEVQAGNTRPEIIRRTQELIQHTLDYYDAGIMVTTVNLVDVGVPEPVVASRNDANKAQADKDRYVLEAQAYQNQILPVAQGAAARMQQDAQAYKAQVVALAQGQASRFTQLQSAYAEAPEVTRRRIYLDTLESVLGRAHKVLIDGKAGSNMIYLPIDKLLEKSNAGGAEAGSDASAGNAKEPTDQVTVEARGRGER